MYEAKKHHGVQVFYYIERPFVHPKKPPSRFSHVPTLSCLPRSHLSFVISHPFVSPTIPPICFHRPFVCSTEPLYFVSPTNHPFVPLAFSFVPLAHPFVSPTKPPLLFPSLFRLFHEPTLSFLPRFRFPHKAILRFVPQTREVTLLLLPERYLNICLKMQGTAGFTYLPD